MEHPYTGIGEFMVEVRISWFDRMWDEYWGADIGGPDDWGSGGNHAPPIDSGGGGGGDDSWEQLPDCAKGAILGYYKSVGNSSGERLKRVQDALDAIITRADGFPITTPPGLARQFGGAENVTAYTASASMIYFDSGWRDFTTAAGTALLAHEFAHIMQYREMAHFPQSYAKEWAKNGSGKKNIFERRGYLNQRQSEAFFAKNPQLLCK